MLAIDKVPLNQYDKNDPIRKHIEAGLNQIKKKKLWKLVPDDSRKRKNEEGRIEYNGGVSRLASAKYSFPHDGVLHDVTYFETINSNTGAYVPHRVNFRESLPLDGQSQSDLIFYMVCVLDTCKPFDMLSQWQTKNPNAQPHYKVEDIAGEAAYANIQKRKIKDLENIIFDDDLGLEDENLANVAISYGFPDAKNMDSELLRFQLHEFLTRKTRGKYDFAKIDKFLQDSKDTSLLKLSRMVEDAIEKGYVLQDKTGKNNRAWYTANIHGERDTHIFTMDKGTNAKVALIKHLSDKPKDRAMFERLYADRTKKGGDLEGTEVKPIELTN